MFCMSHDSIQSDVLVISCDLVTTVPLHLLADFHRSHSSTLTALFVRPTLHAEEQRRKTTSTTGITLLVLHTIGIAHSIAH